MKAIFFLYSAVILCFSGVYATEIEKISERRDQCDILVECGSYGGGIDYQTCGKIKKDISSMNFKKAFQWSWGLEGETSICLLLKPEQNEEAILKRLKSYIPETQKKGPVEVKAK